MTDRAVRVDTCKGLSRGKRVLALFFTTGQDNMIEQAKFQITKTTRSKDVAPVLPPGKLGCLSSSAMVAARPGMSQLSFFSRHCRIISLPLKMNFCNVPESKYSSSYSLF